MPAACDRTLRVFSRVVLSGFVSPLLLVPVISATSVRFTGWAARTV